MCSMPLFRQHYSGASPKLTSSLTTIPPCDPEPSESNDRVRELQSLRYANKSLTQSIYDFQKLLQEKSEQIASMESTNAKTVAKLEKEKVALSKEAGST
ncbi:unnamed protein product [Dracunculus medinensis]|uniref:PRKG1_interact domain-containing protein n=1 Tax=Dracunculus medinensis TaxID=318479 RepID=A0A0N4UE25_DRAME|nr:unnamed protein product [Dracunculus medinensis]